MTPAGYAAGNPYGSRNARFSPTQQTIALKDRHGVVRPVSRVDFVYSAGSIIERVAPAP
jgi:hypothetical protein